MKSLEYYTENIEDRIPLMDSISIEEWAFKEFIREILVQDAKEDNDIIFMYKAQNKKWKILAKKFPKIIHKKNFVRNVKKNINGLFFTWQWFFK